MNLFKLAVIGTIGVVAYRTWQQRRRAVAVSAPADDGGRTPPHGDPLLVGTTIDVETPPRAAAHSSRGFGAP